jgi:hypothetical protein
MPGIDLQRASWNGKLEEIEAVKQRLSSLETERYSLSPEEEIRIRSMGDNFAEVWQSNRCPPTLKKMIFRTAIEEIIVRTDQDKKNLELVDISSRRRPASG